MTRPIAVAVLALKDEPDVTVKVHGALAKVIGSQGVTQVQVQIVSKLEEPFAFAPGDDRSVVQVRQFGELPVFDVLGWVGKTERLHAEVSTDGRRVVPFTAARDMAAMVTVAQQRGWRD